jgi:hypothetical protein
MTVGVLAFRLINADYEMGPRPLFSRRVTPQDANVFGTLGVALGTLGSATFLVHS